MTAPAPAPAPASAPVPVTLLTGFLGSGKTTLLNRILHERHGEKIAVIENEFGAIGLDQDLLQAGDDTIVEMTNGCLCCSVRGDLIRILGRLWTRRAAGELHFDRVLIETTGLAEPAPVAQTFFLDPEVAHRYVLDAVLTLVDAVHAPRQLREHETALAQVAFADRLLLTKTEQLDPATAPRDLAALEAELVRINPRAPIRKTAANPDLGQVSIQDLLDIRGFNLDAVLELNPLFLAAEAAAPHPAPGHHHQRYSAYTFCSERDFDGARLQDFIGSILRVFGDELLRYKGVLAVDALPYQVILQGVHQLMGASPGAPWGDAPRHNRLVFIGRDLPRDILAQGLAQCLR